MNTIAIMLYFRLFIIYKRCMGEKGKVKIHAAFFLVVAKTKESFLYHLLYVIPYLKKFTSPFQLIAYSMYCIRCNTKFTVTLECATSLRERLCFLQLSVVDVVTRVRSTSSLLRRVPLRQIRKNGAPTFLTTTYKYQFSKLVGRILRFDCCILHCCCCLIVPE